MHVVVNSDTASGKRIQMIVHSKLMSQAFSENDNFVMILL